MFFSKFSEGSDYLLEASSSIKIIDITYETFDSFLYYIYTGELDLTTDGCEIDRLMELSYCAQKYLIEEMREQCLKKLRELLNRNTVFMLLGKSFDMHLEDFLVACLYFIADSLEAGTSFNNLMMNDVKSHLSPQCLEFLVKNLLDYLGERDDLLCLIKAWNLVQCQKENLSISDETQEKSLRKLNLDDSLCDKIVQLKSSFVSPLTERILRTFHRVYYKPVRPLIVDKNEMSCDANVSFKRFCIMNSLMINSRLIPEQLDIYDMSNQTYTENLQVEVFEKSSNKSIYNQHYTINDVSYNACFRLKFEGTMLLFPQHVYVFKITWNVDAIGFEYPRCIFSLMEKGSEAKLDDNMNPLSIVQFHEYSYYYNSPFGSIVQGISYDLVS